MRKLFLKGEKKKEKTVDEKDILFKEVTHGRFERKFTLPEGVGADAIKATFKNGILEMVLPKGTEFNAQKVPIEVTATGTEEVKAA